MKVVYLVESYTKTEPPYGPVLEEIYDDEIKATICAKALNESSKTETFVVVPWNVL